jgi:hypothetical protein
LLVGLSRKVANFPISGFTTSSLDFCVKACGP